MEEVAAKSDAARRIIELNQEVGKLYGVYK